MPLEELHGAFVFLRGRARPKGAQISGLARAGVLLSGIETILTGFELANHDVAPEAFFES